jgi:formyltetrahydrofolate deformylase
MRMEFRLEGLSRELERDFAPVAERFSMDWRLEYASERKRVALLASRDDHCLLDLLWRWRRGELDCDVVAAISNHPVHDADVRGFGVPFHHVEAKDEERLLALLAGKADLVVLARYMQVLSAGFLDRLGAPVINIHHSFLPAFVGADPYRRARERGVKIIGATAHYVTADLDEGPIIEQEMLRVDHSSSPEQLAARGREAETRALAHAVRWHTENRVIIHGNRTVVFE